MFAYFFWKIGSHFETNSEEYPVVLVNLNHIDSHVCMQSKPSFVNLHSDRM